MFSFFEFARRHGDFAIVSAACLMELEHETIQKISLVLGGISSHPVRLSQVEVALRGKKLTELDFEQLISSHQFSEMLSDKLYPSWYREHLSRVLISRVFKSALNRSTH
jgi:carbon-monoxide dehydrogenase medium subunit